MIRGLLMSMGMFSIIPVPRNSWNEKYMHLVIPALPVVGLIIGLLWYGTAWLLLWSAIPSMMASVLLLLVPFILSGFIHVDGYMDTADAVLSRRPLEEKKRILKDPNAGAFAVVAIIVLMLLQFSAMFTIVDIIGSIQPPHFQSSHFQPSPLLSPLLTSNLSPECMPLNQFWFLSLSFIAIPIVSRCVTGAALILCKPVFETGYNASFKAGTQLRHLVFICVLGLACVLLSPLMALAGIGAGAGTAVYLRHQFKGISGDLCGCIIVVSECAALVALALCMAL